jgi:hypothetical protein
MAGLRYSLPVYSVHLPVSGWVLAFLETSLPFFGDLKGRGILFPLLPDPSQSQHGVELIQALGGQTECKGVLPTYLSSTEDS